MSERPSYLDAAVYFITFNSYGTRLHGDERGTTDRANNTYGEPTRPSEPRLRDQMAATLKSRPFVIGANERATVSAAIDELCRSKGWTLIALNVRTNHVHALVQAETPVERVMNGLKAAATHRLRKAGLIANDQRVWARHGSTRYLRTSEAVAAVREYIVSRQGQDLAGAAPQPEPID